MESILESMMKGFVCETKICNNMHRGKTLLIQLLHRRNEK